MEQIESINRERLLWCCAERGVTVDELADDVGIGRKKLAAFFDEGEGLTYIQLRKIADYFGRGVLFFLDPGPADPAKVHTPQYRTLASQKPELSFAIKKLIERVERQRERYLALREDLDFEEFPTFTPPQVSTDDIAAAAKIVRQWLKLGGKNTFDSYRAAVEAKGILVFRSNGYAGRWQIAKESPILGFSLYDKRCPVIVVKKARWETQQTFTLMHELGHVLLHRSSSIDDEEDMEARAGDEREANAFAGHLLVPDNFLSTISDADRPIEPQHSDTWLEHERQSWGVSVEMILRRLLDAGRITQKFYTEYRAHVRGMPVHEDASGSRAWRHREPKHIFGEPFVRTVLDALANRQITVTKACSYLDGLKLRDLHQLERHVASL